MTQHEHTDRTQRTNTIHTNKHRYTRTNTNTQRTNTNTHIGTELTRTDAAETVGWLRAAMHIEVHTEEPVTNRSSPCHPLKVFVLCCSAVCWQH